MILTDFFVEIPCRLTIKGAQYIRDTYPLCFKNVPYSLERMIINVTDYQIKTNICRNYSTSLQNFDIVIWIDQLKIVFCERLRPEDLDPKLNNPNSNQRMMYSHRARTITQNYHCISSIKYFLHHQAKVNAQQEFKFDQLQDIQTFVDPNLLKQRDSMIALSFEKQQPQNEQNMETDVGTTGTSDSKYVDESRSDQYMEEIFIEIRDSQESEESQNILKSEQQPCKQLTHTANLDDFDYLSYKRDVLQSKPGYFLTPSQDIDSINLNKTAQSPPKLTQANVQDDPDLEDQQIIEEATLILKQEASQSQNTLINQIIVKQENHNNDINHEMSSDSCYLEEINEIIMLEESTPESQNAQNYQCLNQPKTDFLIDKYQRIQKLVSNFIKNDDWTFEQQKQMRLLSGLDQVSNSYKEIEYEKQCERRRQMLIEKSIQF
ncbi:UNKNOWN [Stylonychia lemnae]|uniref:Uncharacterized protein n=1 Tax=Stylonychia lemnae TaxID=5949 RepID=A0A078AT18_STYLE|nr:UNKNOWN [Stylonychia lemnae]|eukprot:CDW84008.1 UNKNOWN [Stylonychia lemnae]